MSRLKHTTTISTAKNHCIQFLVKVALALDTHQHKHLCASNVRKALYSKATIETNLYSTEIFMPVN